MKHPDYVTPLDRHIQRDHEVPIGPDPECEDCQALGAEDYPATWDTEAQQKHLAGALLKAHALTGSRYLLLAWAQVEMARQFAESPVREDDELPF